MQSLFVAHGSNGREAAAIWRRRHTLGRYLTNVRKVNSRKKARRRREKSRLRPANADCLLLKATVVVLRHHVLELLERADLDYVAGRFGLKRRRFAGEWVHALSLLSR